MSTDDFPYLKVPPEYLPIVGKRIGDTRVYRQEGSEEESAEWFDALFKLTGENMVSPGGVAMYCPVSRAAIHKRTKEGKLTTFLFHVTSQKHLFWGKKVTLRESPYAFVPVSEAKAWKAELEERAISQGIITREELESATSDWKEKWDKLAKVTRRDASLMDAKPDLQGDFMEWESKWEKEQIKKAKEEKP